MKQITSSKEPWNKSHFLTALGWVVAPVIASTLTYFVTLNAKKPKSIPFSQVYARACSHSLVEVGWDSPEAVSPTIAYSFRGEEKECSIKTFSQSGRIRDLEGCSVAPLDLNADRADLGGQSQRIDTRFTTQEGATFQKSFTVTFPETDRLCARSSSPTNACNPVGDFQYKRCQNFFSFGSMNRAENIEQSDFYMEIKEDEKGIIVSAELVAPFGLVTFENMDMCDFSLASIRLADLKFSTRVSLYPLGPMPLGVGRKGFSSRNDLIIVKSSSGAVYLIQGGGYLDGGCTGVVGSNQNYVGILTYPFAYRRIL